MLNRQADYSRAYSALDPNQRSAGPMSAPMAGRWTVLDAPRLSALPRVSEPRAVNAVRFMRRTTSTRRVATRLWTDSPWLSCRPKGRHHGRCPVLANVSACPRPRSATNGRVLLRCRHRNLLCQIRKRISLRVVNHASVASQAPRPAPSQARGVTGRFAISASQRWVEIRKDNDGTV